MKRNISILGSTGSIGTSTLEVVKQHLDRFRVIGLAANTQIDTLIQQIQTFKPKIVSVATKEGAEKVRDAIDPEIEVCVGSEGLIEVATYLEVDFVMNALVGMNGLLPTIEALKAKKDIGIANKESLVAAGHLIKKLAFENECMLYPIDSEHSAIFQCLIGEDRSAIDKLIITASGGAFRDKSRFEMERLSVTDALNHPNWKMGAKITIDCATLMNKGFEVIEAHWLFDVPYEKIEVLIHPESIVHSMVEFHDGSIIAQMGVPDMFVPIQYALSYPDRLDNRINRLNLAEIGKLHFYEPDYIRFPCLEVAIQAAREGGSTTTVLNAANEVANEHFRQGMINFLDIEKIIIKTLEKHEKVKFPSLDEVLGIDEWARSFSSQVATCYVL
ncbi:1-deoxy-D-xylulose-5-phosphate reductoisomerase [Paenibacillus alvei]|uniref:1-deoxy-D-xylulose-5-phosphate reductoisomerase n=1 Tax=Paenibacillus alvei TaxID=44250 RepID=UPI00227EDA64|nr:1-deoxy-D-xylulose-5-phosphate reductoisomerase [Paenibacillus alvei]